MGFKRGIPLTAISETKPELLVFLQESYGITTCEELVEASSFSKELEVEADARVKSPGAFRALHDMAVKRLGEDAAEALQRFRRRYPTGALKPR